MALSGYEKQKRWREKNRALYNFQQRERRKNLSGGARERVGNHVGEKSPPPTPPTQSKVEELRALMERASSEPDAPMAKPLVYRDDYGRVITESQWKRLEARKEEAKTNGYDIDEYSQF